MKKIMLVVIVAGLLSGCTIPRAAFKSSLIHHDDPAFSLIEVTPAFKTNDSDISQHNIPDAIFNDTDWQWTSLTAGDVLHITILSSGGAGYLSDNSNGDRADFDNIFVADDQTVRVPYAGTIAVNHLNVRQLADEITQRLSRVVLNPQVLVTLTARTGAMVTLEGSSGKMGRFPLDQSMNHLSHFLAATNMENASAEMTEISVTRQQHNFRVRLADLYQQPALDIALQPDDRITVRQVTDYVNVLGAAGTQGKHALVKRDSSILDAIALAKGLNDKLADPQAVFLFKHNETQLASQQGRKPNIYHVDMSLPDSVFRARKLKIADGDVIYISNASLTDLAKVQAAFGAFLSRSTNAL